MFSKDAKLRRARPLLGTFVEITIPAGIGDQRTLEHAFAKISRVHSLMSAHESSSDLGLIAQARVGKEVQIDHWTWRVLAFAQKFACESEGAFDVVAVASRRGINWQDLELLSDSRVRCLRRLRIDLGGIAKGFAVDQAVRALRRAGVAWGMVNAGGDLRAFGERQWPLQVRHPAQPETLLEFAPVRNAAVATSAPYFTRQTKGVQTTSALIDPLRNNFITESVSTTVIAPTALVADALTKIVLLAPAKAEAMLRYYRAQACYYQSEMEIRHAG